jgi:hypothetical protein
MLGPLRVRKNLHHGTYILDSGQYDTELTMFHALSLKLRVG